MSVRVSAQRLFGIYSKSLPRNAKYQERLQTTCVDLLRLSAWPDVQWHHSPNEGHRHAVGHFIQEAVGRIKGFPDLVIWRAFDPAHPYPLYFVEFPKKGSKKPDPDQIAFLKDQAERGHRVAAPSTFDEFRVQALAWGLLQP